MKIGSLYGILALAVLISGCRKETPTPETPPPPVNEEEVITTLVITFVNAEPGVDETFQLRYADVDGDGGQDPVITADVIPPGRYFNVTTRVLNESVSPTVDLTSRIVTEGVDHQFFYMVDGAGLSFSNLNTDVNGLPIGTTSNATTTTAGNGTLTVVLRHEPDKSAEGVAAGDITNAGGETDIEAVFPIAIQ